MDWWSSSAPWGGDRERPADPFRSRSGAALARYHCIHMSWDTLIRRRFEVASAAIMLGLLFVLVVWAGMVLFKAVDPHLFHFNLLMDILPWLTPVLILLVLGLPLYWVVAGWLQPPEGAWPPGPAPL